MAEVIWTEPALQELDAIAEYIALDDPAAASLLVKTVLDKTKRLQDFSTMITIFCELVNRDSSLDSSTLIQVGFILHSLPPVLLIRLHFPLSEK